MPLAARLQRPHTVPDPPLCALFLVQVRFARRRSRPEAARGPRTGWSGRVRALEITLYRLGLVLRCSGALIYSSPAVRQIPDVLRMNRSTLLC